jgi:hypothetical protein
MDWKKKIVPTLRHAVENPQMTRERERKEAATQAKRTQQASTNGLPT